MDRSWALARRMIGSPPTPYCSAANSNERSLTSLAKLSLIPAPVPHRSQARKLGDVRGGFGLGGLFSWGSCRRLAPAAPVPIMADVFCGLSEGWMAGNQVAIMRASQANCPSINHTADTLDALGIGYVAKI